MRAYLLMTLAIVAMGFVASAGVAVAYGVDLTEMLGALSDPSAPLDTWGALPRFFASLATALLPIGSRLSSNGDSVPCLLGTADCWALASSWWPLPLRDLMAPLLEPGSFATTMGAVGIVAFLLGRLTGRSH